MAAEQGAGYSDDEYGSAGEDAYDQDEYEEDDGPPRSIEAVLPAPRAEEASGIASEPATGHDADAKDEAADYDREEEFEAEGSVFLGNGSVDPVSEPMQITHETAAPAAVAPAATSSNASATTATSQPGNAPASSDARKPLLPSRSFSVPSVPSIPLANAVDASQRSASVSSVPVAALKRWADGYEHVSDGEGSPRSKHTLVPLPVLEETRPASLSEEEGDGDNWSDSDDSDEASPSGGNTQSQTVARLRSLSLQQRTQQPVVVPARKSKSQMYLTRLPSVSELVAEDVAQLGLPTAMAKHTDTSTCSIKNIDEGDAVTLQDENDLMPSGPHERGAEGDATAKLTSADEVHGVVSPDITAITSSDVPNRRETEQLMWDLQTLINAQRADQADMDNTQAAIASTDGEDDAQAARDRGDSLIEYGNEELSDEGEVDTDEVADKYAADDDAFSDDNNDAGEQPGEADESEEPGKTLSSNESESNARIFAIAELDEGNRRETEALLWEAQALILAQRDDLDTEGDVGGSTNALQSVALDLYGEDNDFGEDEASDFGGDDPYLTDEEDPVKNVTEERRVASSSVVDLGDAGICSVGRREGELSSKLHSSEGQSHVQEKSSDDTTDQPNADAPRVLSSNNSSTVHLDRHGESEAVTADVQEAASEGSQPESTRAVEPSTASSSPLKRPRPPPAKAKTEPTAGRRATSNASTASRPTPPLQASKSCGRASRIPRTSNSTRQAAAIRDDTGVGAQSDEHTTNVNDDVSTSNAASDSTLASAGAAPRAEQTASPTRSTRRSPSKRSQPLALPDEYPPLPRKESVPRQKKAVKKPLSPELLRELKPVRSPANLRIDTQIIDKDKRDWLFLNMFRHGDDVGKYEPFLPRSVLSQPSMGGSTARPPSAGSTASSLFKPKRAKASTPYGYGGRKLLKPRDPMLAEREKNWVATKPLDSAIPAYDSILDKYCATVTSPVIQRHIYHTRYQDLSPQLAFVLEKRVEQHFRQVVRAAKSPPASSYHADSTGQ